MPYISLPDGEPSTYIYRYHISYTCWPCISLPAAGLFWNSRLLRGTQGGRVHTTAQAWAPVGLRSACSGSSKSRGADPFRRTVSRRTRAKQGVGNPHEIIPRQDFLCSAVYMSSHIRGSHITIAVSLQALPCVVAWNHKVYMKP